MSLEIPISSDSLVQYGAIGIILLYFLTLDHFERKRKNKREDEENAARTIRETEAAEREKECIKSHAEIRKHQIEVLTPLIRTSNQINKATLEFLAKRKFNSPLPIQVEDLTISEDEMEEESNEDETKIIRRR